MVEFDVDVEFFGSGFDCVQVFGYYFLVDVVIGDYGDFVGFVYCCCFFGERGNWYVGFVKCSYYKLFFVLDYL